MSSTGASLWRHSDFLKLWTGESISLIGSQITFLALPLTLLPGAIGGLLAVFWVFFSPVRSLIQTPALEDEPTV